MPLKSVTLDDKYDLSQDRVFLSGSQAVVRLTLMQKERDRRAALDTAGYVTGYRGSPLGGLDQQFARAQKLLAPQDIVFQPGLNEDLAATALWGTQQAEMRGEGRFDGVFGIWYGKGPGVDRSGDVLRHANLAGSSPNGGVIALMGDDHTCESSTTAHQSEFAFVDAMIPILSPAGVQEILDYGLHGWGLSRFAGTWAGIKCVKDTIESTSSVDGRTDRVEIVRPDFPMPPGGLNIRPNDPPIVQEARLHDYKRNAVLAYLRANRLDRIVMAGGRSPRIGIVTLGKSYLDVRQALDDLGIDEVRAADLGLRLYKLACPWPVEPEGVKRFAADLDLVIVVEEKRSLVETQLKEQLYGAANPPVIVGKQDEDGRALFPAKGALDPNDIGIAIGERILRFAADEEVAARLQQLRRFQKVLAETQDVSTRIPYFCAGCPHSSSTVVPEGSRAYAGIGCHYMAQWMERSTEGFTHMGGEGANWIGEANFSTRGHVFQNIGDGTYNHSGYLAIRAAKAAGVNVTYKILYNDAVAMTGGQCHEGGLTVDEIARQVAAEGARRIVIVSDEPDKYPAGTEWPAGTTIRHRDDILDVQEELREVPGLSALIYDQTCAAEKRRRRKRGQFPDPDQRVFINELVCEGCGDCGAKSNCVAVTPVETEFGRKRQIDQSACNKDFSCLKGFCPSFVTVEGGRLKKGTGSVAAEEPDTAALPEPELPELDGTYGIVVTGVGGTGVVTIGALIGMAAHLEGKGCGIIDMAGLAQKGGSVLTHLKLAPSAEDISAIRVSAGSADLVLGCDMVVAGSKKVLGSVDAGRTAVIVNTHEAYPGEFTRNADFSLPVERLKRAITERAGAGHVHMVEATRLATALLGDAILANIFMLGFAWQLGRVPLSGEALRRAIELNGVSVAQNLAAFRWGRQAAHDLASVEDAAAPAREAPTTRRLSESLEEIIERRADYLTDYQDRAYAERYLSQVARVRAAEQRAAPGRTELADAVSRYLFKLMAYKDEYEVARLYTDGSFARAIGEKFEGDFRLTFHLAPPVLSKPDARTGEPRKMSFGPWMMRGFRLLAAMRRLRGTPLDIFGYSKERRTERKLVADYEALLDEFVASLSAENHAAAVALASVPEKIRGYGHVKERHLAAARPEEAALLEAYRAGGAPVQEAAE